VGSFHPLVVPINEETMRNDPNWGRKEARGPAFGLMVSL
jgi:hypothetical protein